MYKLVPANNTFANMVMVTDMAVIIIVDIMAYVEVATNIMTITFHVVIEGGSKVAILKERKLYTMISMSVTVEATILATKRLTLMLTVPLTSPYQLLAPSLLLMDLLWSILVCLVFTKFH